MVDVKKIKLEGDIQNFRDVMKELEIDDIMVEVKKDDEKLARL